MGLGDVSLVARHLSVPQGYMWAKDDDSGLGNRRITAEGQTDP